MSKIEDYNKKREDLNQNIAWFSEYNAIRNRVKRHFPSPTVTDLISIGVPSLFLTCHYKYYASQLFSRCNFGPSSSLVEYFKKAILNDFDNLLKEAIHLQENDLKEAAKEALKESKYLMDACGLDINTLEEEK
jgi:hypothetical protein